MTKKRRQFDKGIKLRPDTSAVTEEGEVKYDDTSKKVQYRDDSTTRDVVSEDGTQTLTNKTIDADSNTVSNLEVDNLKAGVLDTDLTAVSASDDTIPSAKATKDYVDAQVASKDEASEISYDGTTSGLSATDVQAAVDEVDANADAHIADATDAHDASAISYDNTTSGLTATEAQAAIDEVEGRLDTAETGLSDHLADAVDAHDGTAISYSDSQGIGQTTVEGAIDLIVTDHIDVSTDVHGVGATADVVGTDTTQTLTNKTIQGASIETPSRSDVKQDTKANLVTYASSASNGQTVYATDTKEFFVITDNALVEVGGGAGDVDYLTVIKDFDTSSGLTTEASGVNAGTFRLTHDAVSTEFAEKTIAVTNKFRDKQLALRIDKRSTASLGNFKVIVTDETNSRTLADEVIAPQDTTPTDKKMVTFFTDTPEGGSEVASIKVRFEALAEAGAPFSEFDDVVVDLQTTEARSIEGVVQETNTFSAKIQNNGTASIISQSESFISSVTRSALGTVEVAFKPGFFTVAPVVQADPSSNTDVSGNASAITTSGCTIRTEATSGGTNGDWDIDMIVHRQGSDYKNIEKRVEREVSTFKEVIQEEADSSVSVNEAGGAGSSANYTYWFETLKESIGSSVSYESSSVIGDNMVAEEDGIYHVSCSVGLSSSVTDATIALVKNSSNRAASYTTLPISEILVSGEKRGNGTNSNPVRTASWSGFLNKGDKVSVQLDAILSPSSLSTSDHFTMAKVGVPKIASVAPDSKIDIPTSELRMEGAASKGTGSESRTVAFDTLSKIRGDAITVNNTNGTIVTINKDGYVSLTASLKFSTVVDTYLTLNETDPSSTPPIGEQLSHVTTAGAGYHGEHNAGFFAKAGDKLRINTAGTPNGTNDASLNITHQEQRIQVAVSNVTPQYEDADSMVRLKDGNGFGSTNTKIRRFSTVVDNIGSDVVYTDSATLGASFEIVNTGFYSITYVDGNFGSTGFFGLSLNASGSDFTTDLSGISSTKRIAEMNSSNSGDTGTVSWSGILNAGDIIRPHVNAAADSAGRQYFTIAKVGVPSIAEVDVTPFVDFQSNDWKVNSIKMEGNDGRVVTANTEDIQYSGSGIGWTSVGDTHYYTVQDSNSIVTISGSAYFVTPATTSSVKLALNGTNIKRVGLDNYSGGGTACMFEYTSSRGEFQAGDQLSFRSEGGGTLNNLTLNHYLNIVESYKEDTYERIYAVENNENEFSARISNTGSILSQSSNWIDTVTPEATTGQYTVKWIDGFFTEIPSVSAITTGNATDDIRVLSVSINNVVLQITNPAGSAANDSFDVQVSRQGADRKDLQRQLASISDFPRVNNQLTGYIQHIAGGNTLLNRGATSNYVQADLSNLQYSGDSLIVARNASNRTEYVALRDCIVHVTFAHNGAGATSNSFIWRSREASTITNGSTGYTTSAYCNSSASFDLKKGEYFFNLLGSVDITNSATPYNVNIIAQAQELERVTSATLGNEHIFYSGFTSDNAQFYALLPTEEQNTSGELIEVTNTDHTRYTAKTDISVTATVQAEYTIGGFSVQLYIYDENDILLVRGRDYAAANNHASATLTYQMKKGDYAVMYTGSDNFSNSPFTNFSIKAEPASVDTIIALPVPKVAILKDVKASGTGGGTSLASAVQTRDLNTVSGDTEIVSLLANQFTLGRGKYEISARTPGYDVNQHQCHLYNITDSVISIEGACVYTNQTYEASTDSTLNDIIVLTKDTTFELRHFTAFAAGNGLGIECAGIGGNPTTNNIYSELKITKLD